MSLTSTPIRSRPNPPPLGTLSGLEPAITRSRRTGVAMMSERVSRS